jgi:hypothetical protein
MSNDLWLSASMANDLWLCFSVLAWPTFGGSVLVRPTICSSVLVDLVQGRMPDSANHGENVCGQAWPMLTAVGLSRRRQPTVVNGLVSLKPRLISESKCWTTRQVLIRLSSALGAEALQSTIRPCARTPMHVSASVLGRFDRLRGVVVQFGFGFGLRSAPATDRWLALRCLRRHFRARIRASIMKRRGLRAALCSSRLRCRPPAAKAGTHPPWH